MKGKVFSVGLLILGLSNFLFAEQVVSTRPLLSFSDSIATSFFSLPASEDSSNYHGFAGIQRNGAIGLNFLFGAGSYLMGDIGHGVILTLLEAGGIALVALPFIMGLEVGLSDKGKTNSLSAISSPGSSLYNDNLTPESNIAVWLWGGGGLLLMTDILLNILYPLTYDRYSAKTAMLNDTRNWDVSFVPGKNGRGYGQISFTAHF
ncbi:MAG: hypothetical protein LBP76_03320 [Treponema sp.]|nr:hypothetical protein [Treponema sp.]